MITPPHTGLSTFQIFLLGFLLLGALWFRVTAAVANILFPNGELLVLFHSLEPNDFVSIWLVFYGIASFFLLTAIRLQCRY